MFCWSFLVFTFFQLVNNDELYKTNFSLWISSTSDKRFFSQKYNINTFDLLKLTSMYFVQSFGFWEESHWFIPIILKNFIWFINIATNFSFCFLEKLYLVLLLAIIWKSRNLEKSLTIWMFTVWESLFPNHKSESLKHRYIFILYIFQKLYSLNKLQNTISIKMFCICKI